MPTKPEAARAPRRAEHDETLLSIRDLRVHYALRGSSLARLFGRDVGTVKAVDGIDLEIAKGEVLGLVGESGSGKSTLGRAVLGLAPITGGSIAYEERRIETMSGRALREVRRNLQMVFQDPSAALNPAMDIETAVGHPLRIHRLARGDELRRRVVDALERVGLSPADQFLTKYPGELSGGQKQRAVIARAIILDPVLLIADEPISMLDMSVRSKLLQLMLDLKADLDLTYVYITHDLASAKFFCDRVAIMYLGRVVEIGTTEEIFADPKHPYTQSLVGAIPDLDPDRSTPRDLPRGEIPDAASPPLGCAFHPRCPQAFDKCGWESRDLRVLLESHWTTVPEAEYDAERAIIGDVDALDLPDHVAALPAGRGHSGGDVERVLDTIHAADPDEPFWRGVRQRRVVDAGVGIDFHEGEDPALRPAGGVQVACHLYPPPGDAAGPPPQPKE
ncbi:ABC transporter ATP-binding protein [Nocardioides sp. YIM 152315]|uniref:ABC transporter ATP-binding protein n=1 Tax=Nocardioides sp. YIM 152315 TaxID=3031760 RepID=UPI0023DC4062|nr:ABC transporter ATP-binding protein [Nocardioides sp. YIM 152315]MDF1602604.1 ABC transporter ATP-binding protein [Nocardioides sp. YIM 152315]